MQQPWQKYFDPQTLAKVHGLSLRARRIVEGFIAGQHRSSSRGFSIEFAEHREYAPGDDLRFVDWKAFGRTDKFYLKQFEDETSLSCYLLLDVSESMQYQHRSSGLSKLEYAKCVAASLAWLIIHQHDAVGLIVFDRKLQTVLPPLTTAAHLNHLLLAMESAQPGGPTELEPVLHEIAHRCPRRGVVVLISDLLDDPQHVVRGLRHLRYNQHDVSVLHCLDRAELEFPFRGMTQFNGLEGQAPVVTDPAYVRQAYRDQLQQFRQRLERGCRERQIDYYLTPTDQQLDTTLSHLLASRKPALNRKR